MPGVRLEGQINARSLGGIAAAGGVLAENRLIRSGELSQATENDLAALTHIRLGTVVDLRTGQERARKPDRLPSSARLVCCPVVDELVPGITRESVEDPRDGLLREGYAEELRGGGMAKMRSLYPILVESENAVREYRRFFGCVLENESGALLFHCAMGKDRAGVAAALLLYALGASMSDIMADYMLTAQLCADKILRETEECRAYTDDEALLRDIYWLNTTHESYLEAMFQSCIKQCGSVDSYLERRLGIGTKQKSQLREMYIV